MALTFFASIGTFGTQGTLGVRTAHAQAAEHGAAAEDLFQRGKSLMGARDFEAACPLLAESYRLDPAGGALQNLAVCYEELGKWASSYARFEELRTISKNAVPPRTDRIKLAEEHIARIKPRLSRVVVVIDDPKADAAEVELDGVSYRRASWSTGILVDPGTHALVVHAPGKQAYQATLAAVAEGSAARLVVPALIDEAPRPGRDDAAAIEQEKADKRLRTTGWIVGGVGASVLAAGAVFGVLTFTTNHSAKERCERTTNAGAPAADFDPSGRCYVDSPTWRQANASKDDARTFANVANVLVPVGAVAVAVGAYLVLKKGSAGTRVDSEPRSSTSDVRAELRLVPSAGGAMLQGSF